MPIDTHVPDSTFVTAIAQLVHPEPEMKAVPRGQNVILVGKEYHLIGNPLLAEPKALQVATLQAIVDGYNKASSFGSDLTNLMVHVVSPTEVRLLDPAVGEELQQFVYMKAVFESRQLSYGQYYPVDEFITSLHSMFGPTEGRNRLLAHVGNLTVGMAADMVDNGASQIVTTRSGITRAGEPTAFDNPVGLQPFRTFSEIEQPVSNFAMRMRQVNQGEAKTANIALFEADGGQWKLEAITAIGAWLRDKLPDATILA